jgi:hypothetical protein
MNMNRATLMVNKYSNGQQIDLICTFLCNAKYGCKTSQSTHQSPCTTQSSKDTAAVSTKAERLEFFALAYQTWKGASGTFSCQPSVLCNVSCSAARQLILGKVKPSRTKVRELRGLPEGTAIAAELWL